MKEQLRRMWTDMRTAFWQLLSIVTQRLAVVVAHGMRLASEVHDGFTSLRRAVIRSVPGVRNRIAARVCVARSLAEAAVPEAKARIAAAVPEAKARIAAAKDLVADVKADAKATWAQRQAELRAAEKPPPAPQRTETWPWHEEPTPAAPTEPPVAQHRPAIPAAAAVQRAPEFAPSEADSPAVRVSADRALPLPGKLRTRLATIAAMSRARVAAVGATFSVTVANMRVAAREVRDAVRALGEPRTPAGHQFQQRLGVAWARAKQVSRLAAEGFLAMAATWLPKFGQWGRQAWQRSSETRAKVSVLFGGWQFLRGIKPVAIGAGVVAVVLGIGFGVAHLSQEQIPVAAPADPVPSPTRAAPLAPPPLVIAPDVTQRVLPLSRFNPITGPDRPPLPEDANGPHGSLRTTGTYEVALTLDDGPDPRWTPDVLETLRQYRVKATFCVIGVNVVEFPELVREIAADGHTLCNHSWAHDTSLGNRSYATIVADMQRTNDAIRAAAPRARISYFRHPGGNWTANAVRAARSLGMTSLHWDVDPRDWLRPGARAISSMVTSSAVPGSIVLMHDGGGDRRGSAEALRSILPNLLPRFPLVALPPGVDPPKLYGIHLPVHAGQE